MPDPMPNLVDKKPSFVGQGSPDFDWSLLADVPALVEGLLRSAVEAYLLLQDSVAIETMMPKGNETALQAMTRFNIATNRMLTTKQSLLISIYEVAPKIAAELWYMDSIVPKPGAIWKHLDQREALLCSQLVLWRDREYRIDPFDKYLVSRGVDTVLFALDGHQDGGLWHYHPNHHPHKHSNKGSEDSYALCWRDRPSAESHGFGASQMLQAEHRRPWSVVEVTLHKLAKAGFTHAEIDGDHTYHGALIDLAYYITPDPSEPDTEELEEEATDAV